MVSRRFACLFLAVSMTLSSIWIVSADQSHQIQDAAEAAASYSAAVQALEEAGPFALLILDVNLPDGSGLAIVQVFVQPVLLMFVFSLLMSDFFDTMGTAMAVAKQGEFLTEDGNVEDIRPILVVDSVAAAAGGFMGVSSITTFVESTSGAADGGRTGLTSVTTGVLFILAAFFSPIVTIVSSAATCGALVYVGYLMMSEASEIDWSDVSQGFPAFMIVAGVPFTYSISAGIGLGFIAYVIVALFKGEASKIKPLMWIAALAFLVYFFVA